LLGFVLQGRRHILCWDLPVRHQHWALKAGLSTAAHPAQSRHIRSGCILAMSTRCPQAPRLLTTGTSGCGLSPLAPLSRRRLSAPASAFSTLQQVPERREPPFGAADNGSEMAPEVPAALLPAAQHMSSVATEDAQVLAKLSLSPTLLPCACSVKTEIDSLF
jgi:hypothetical protein